MKTYTKIITIIVAFTLLIVSINARQTAEMKIKKDRYIKQVCQYTLHGKGKRNQFFMPYLLGVIAGASISVPLEKKTEFAKKSDYASIHAKVCQNALNNITEYGFESDYNIQLLSLISTEY